MPAPPPRRYRRKPPPCRCGPNAASNTRYSLARAIPARAFFSGHSAMMTHKDFELIARAMRTAREHDQGITTPVPTREQNAAAVALNDAAFRLAQALEIGR